MINLNYSPRRVFMEDVVAVPATATTSSAIIYSDVFKPFEESIFGKLTVFVNADDSKISVASPNLEVMVSYDEGETWVLADEVEIDNASFSFTVEEVADYVPRAKLALDLNGATLAEDHGIKVDVLFEEAEENYRRTVFNDVLTVPAEVANPVNNEVLEGKPLPLPAYPVSAIAVFTADDTKLTADLNARMQSSWDGENWWNLGTAVTEVAGEDYKEISIADGDLLGRYLRFNLTVDAAAGAIAEDHNINVDVIVFDRG